MLLGLHRASSLFAHFSIGTAEFRHRLWYTILEVDLIFSVGSGMPPSIEPDSWDTSYPSAIKDDDLIMEGVDQSPRLSVPEGEGIAATSFAALATSIFCRMRIVKMINQKKLSLPCEEVLRLGAELQTKRKTFHDLLSTFEHLAQRKDFHGIVHDLGDLVFERTILLLHRPFAIKFSPRSEFSEYTCLKSAFSILQKLCSASQSDFDQVPGSSDAGLLNPLAETGGFFFESDASNAAFHVFLSIIWYANSTQTILTMTGPPLEDACVEQLQNFLSLARRRLRLPYPSGKAFIVPSMTLEYLVIVNATGLADPELPAKLAKAGDQIARTSLTHFLKQPRSVINHIIDSEAIVETTSFLF
jgi:hypothetical protein